MLGVMSLPLRFASARVTASKRSSSSSLRCLTALGRSLGRTCRPSCDDETCVGADGDGSSMPSVAKRSRFTWWVRVSSHTGRMPRRRRGSKWWRVVSNAHIGRAHAQRSARCLNPSSVACFLSTTSRRGHRQTEPQPRTAFRLRLPQYCGCCLCKIGQLCDERSRTSCTRVEWSIGTLRTSRRCAFEVHRQLPICGEAVGRDSGIREEEHRIPCTICRPCIG